VINIVGDMATWHHGADALLEMDVDALARTVSAHSHRSAVPGAARDDALDALRATKRRAYDRPSAEGFGRVATLIVPHDRSWERPSGLLANLARDDDDDDDSDDAVDDDRVAKTREFIAGCAAALVACAPGKAAVYCGGDALIADDGALQAAGDVAAMVDAVLLCENAFARIDRGGGLPHPTRLPYFPQDAARALAAFDVVVTADARRPIAMVRARTKPPADPFRLLFRSSSSIR
jgi:acetolactate synthase-1/2/3 large subunit